jgi:hypothetical protein
MPWRVGILPEVSFLFEVNPQPGFKALDNPIYANPPQWLVITREDDLRAVVLGPDAVRQIQSHWQEKRWRGTRAHIFEVCYRGNRSMGNRLRGTAKAAKNNDFTIAPGRFELTSRPGRFVRRHHNDGRARTLEIQEVLVIPSKIWKRLERVMGIEPTS